ncbi:ATP-binding protein [Proteiniclasticum sp. BAD-10]|uniref:ATP-binding protein n=1 Tax=Proteiniclasticum sediminis TaxID=2804028 RepID=A0A941CSB0_9CLOT|nr:ATP-binding protein [Proteiniclasticum sediminis]MBR0576456.1 ATP-binding protein [Proteiniclasticum sediminis]
MDFIGRTYELEDLENQYRSNQFEMSVIYGRRRIGKTTLINKFITGKENAGYAIGIESSLSLNLEILSKAIYQATGFPAQLPSFKTLPEAFTFLFEASTNKRIIFVIDEYPYLANAEPSVSSVLQATIDHYRSHSKLMLILCGSSLSFMENQVLGYKSPLYGRRTAQYKIKPFTYWECRQYLSSFSNEDASMFFAITGGVAEYLSFVDPDLSLRSNIINLYLTPSGRLFEEPRNLLQQEMREPKIYNDILSAIAHGSTRNHEIASKIGQTSGALSHYLKALMELGIIEKRTPIGEKTERKSIYVIVDGMYRFWYKFVRPNLQAIELRQGDIVFDERIAENLSEFMGFEFEQMAIQYLESCIQRNEVPFYILEYGNWWGNNPYEKRQEEIDIVALGNNAILFGECKWRNQKLDTKVFDALRSKARLFPQENKQYMLFSKSGFTEDLLKESADQQNVQLIDLEKMYWIKETASSS